MCVLFVCVCVCVCVCVLFVVWLRGWPKKERLPTFPLIFFFNHSLIQNNNMAARTRTLALALRAARTMPAVTPRRGMHCSLRLNADNSGGNSQEAKEADKQGPQQPQPRKPSPNEVQEQITGEQGGPKGPEPTRYGDWERKGRVSDF